MRWKVIVVVLLLAAIAPAAFTEAAKATVTAAIQVVNGLVASGIDE